MRLIRLNMCPAYQFQVLDITVFATRGVRPIRGRAKTPCKPSLFWVNSARKKIHQALTKNALGQTVRNPHAVDKGLDEINASPYYRRLRLTRTDNKNQIAVDDVGKAPSRRIG